MTAHPMTSASQTVANVDGLSIDLVTESGLSRAVEALSLTIKAGETFALVGESGCGKSMTAMAMLRLLPDNALIRSGSMQLNGVDLFEFRERDMQTVRGGRISIIFQEPATCLNPVMTIGDQLVETIQHHLGLKKKDALLRASEWLKRVGLSEPDRRMSSYPFEMSGGQLQRVMIAIALAAEPDLLIADEPTTALDVTIQAQILSLLKRLQSERGMALMLITHDLAVVKGMAKSIALMYAGQIVEVAQTSDFFNDPQHPYARLLLGAIPDFSKRGTSLKAIDGSVPALTTVFRGCRFYPRCPWTEKGCKTDEIALLTHPSGNRSVRCVPALRGISDSDRINFNIDNTTLKSEPALQHGNQDEVLVSVKNLKVTYTSNRGLFQEKKEFEAVRGVDLQLVAGQTLALVGESGCGKTTIGKALLKILGAQVKLSGTITIGGRSLMKASVPELMEIRREIQIIFQNPFASLSPRQRIRDILQEGMITLRPKWTAEERRNTLVDLMDKVGLRQDSLDRYPHEFSGGQRQRIAIARALAVRPKIIVCDEPTSALDVSVQAQILNLLKNLQRELSVSYLLISHNLGVVSYLGDKIAVMRGGEFVEQGEVSQILSQPAHPYTRELLAAVPSL